MSRPVATECPKRTLGPALSEASGSSIRHSSHFPIVGTIGSAMRKEYALSTKPRTEADEEELEALLEAARRATWDALHGPRHLRSGRFHPEEPTISDEREGPAERETSTCRGFAPQVK